MKALLIDIGNTSFHWRLYDAEAESIRPTFSTPHQRDWKTSVEKVLSTLADTEVNKILIASVSGPEIEDELKELLSPLNAPILFIESEAERNGVVNGYTTPEQIGVDRWLVVLEAHKIISEHDYAAALVVDAGTAMTIDAVTQYGEHLGGSIIAGWSLQQRTLLKNTQEILASDGELLVFGKDTASAVAGGAVLALVGAIKESLSALKSGLNDDVSILLMLTGGDAELLEDELLDALDVDIYTADNLVIDGLKLYV